MTMSQPMDPVTPQEHEPSTGGAASRSSTASGSTSILSAHGSEHAAEHGSHAEHQHAADHQHGGGHSGLGHAAPLGATPAHAAKAARLALVALVTGAISSVTAWWQELALLGIVLGAVAVAAGLLAQMISTDTRQRVMAVTGMTGGGFGAMMGIAFGGLPFG